jgi:hypothetical protein
VNYDEVTQSPGGWAFIRKPGRGASGGIGKRHAVIAGRDAQAAEAQRLHDSVRRRPVVWIERRQAMEAGIADPRGTYEVFASSSSATAP